MFHINKLIQISDTMDKIVYPDILQNHMLPFANKKISTEWPFQNDNELKYSSKLIKTFLIEQNILM